MSVINSPVIIYSINVQTLVNYTIAECINYRNGNHPPVVITLPDPQVNLKTSDLPNLVKSRFLDLLTEIADVFTETEICLARSHVVKYSITTTGNGHPTTT